jgi:hypothetical protein
MDSRLYERSRRLSALAGGGLLAAAALVAFIYQLPATFFPFLGGPWWLEWLAFAVLYMAYATASLPFDIWSGYWLPCRHQQECRLLPVFLGVLFRSEAVQFTAMTLSALAMLSAGRAWGVPGALAAMAAAQGALVALRPRVARLLGAAESRPLAWRAWLPGFVWNLAGMAWMLMLPWCGVSSVYQLVEAMLGCSFWSLAGYWLLRGRRREAAQALLYQSWACFGLFSRATAGLMGSPGLWAAARGADQEAEKNACVARQISSTWSRNS